MWNALMGGMRQFPQMQNNPLMNQTQPMIGQQMNRPTFGRPMQQTQPMPPTTTQPTYPGNWSGSVQRAIAPQPQQQPTYANNWSGQVQRSLAGYGK